MNAYVGQYSDYINFSDMAFGMSCYCCGQDARWSGDHHALCDGCHFRHTVMKAAGREEEFWKQYESPAPAKGVLSALQSEMSYRLAASVDAIIRATGDCTENG